jgi:hypothetical protein
LKIASDAASPMQDALDIAGSTIASSLRMWRGTRASAAARQPERMLELYEFEACAYCRLVREALTELDLDAKIFPCPRGGRRFRPRVMTLGGLTQFPYLVDPNTGLSSTRRTAPHRRPPACCDRSTWRRRRSRPSHDLPQGLVRVHRSPPGDRSNCSVSSRALTRAESASGYASSSCPTCSATQARRVGRTSGRPRGDRPCFPSCPSKDETASCCSNAPAACSCRTSSI